MDDDADSERPGLACRFGEFGSDWRGSIAIDATSEIRASLPPAPPITAVPLGSHWWFAAVLLSIGLAAAQQQRLRRESIEMPEAH